MNPTMNGKDGICGASAECYVTLEGRRYNFMTAKKVEASIKKTKTGLKVLGRTGTVNKSTGWEGTGKATFYYNIPLFRELLERFKNTGEDIYFDMQIKNDDKSSQAGSQTTILKDCNIDGGVIALFDVDADTLEEDLDFTFDDFEIPEKFKILEGM